MSISMDPELGDQVRAAAASAGEPLSAWIADAAASKLRAEALSAFLDAYEDEHGAFKPEELEEARAKLGLPSS